MPKRCDKETSETTPQQSANVELRVPAAQYRHMDDTQAPLTITVHQAAEALQVQPATVYAWIRNGEFPHVRLGGRIRIPTAKFAEMLGVTPEELVKGLG